MVLRNTKPRILTLKRYPVIFIWEFQRPLGVQFSFHHIDILLYCYQAWLIEEHSDDKGAGASSLAFSRNAPITVKNILKRVLSDEQTGDTSNTPCFHICSQFHHRMKVDILILSKGVDCRLTIRTCKEYN